MILSSLLCLALAPLPASVEASELDSIQSAQDKSVGRVVVLLREGRELIAQGRGEEARALLQEADKLDEGRLRTRMWLARALVEMNYLNDALDLIDGLAADGHEGAAIDYLYGMAFTYKARKYIVEGVGGGMIGMHFADSVNYLASATEADPVRYADAFLPLAEAAWHSQRLEVARDAAVAAVAISGGRVAETTMLGEVAFSQFVVANGDESRQAEAQARWQEAFESFQAVAKNANHASVSQRAAAHKKSADALLWKGQMNQAADSYAHAMGLDPASVAFDQILGSLGQEAFVACLEAGSAAFDRSHEADDASDATLLWWLGWARLNAKDYERAEQAFTQCMAKWPAYLNCKWYIALCKFHTSDMDGAIAEIQGYVEQDMAGLIGSVQSDFATNLGILDSMIGYCFSQRRAIDAARLSAVQANAAPEHTRYWNNVGLFYRDAGDSLPKDQLALREQYFEKAFEGYSRALDLEPMNPALLNDAAVILHYCLLRDLDQASEMYTLSNERAAIELERTDLDEETRQLYSIAKRDSGNNLARLEAMIRRANESVIEESEGSAEVEAPAGGN